MADIDFITILTNRFEVSLTDNPRGVTGNRALLNRFEITFLTKRKQFLQGNDVLVDTFGGDAERFVGVPRVLEDTQSIAASLSAVIDNTVDSLKNDTTDQDKDTERIESAELVEIYNVSGVITAKIRVIPVETENYSVLEFNLPIIRG